MNRFYEIHVEVESNCLLDCKHCSSTTIRKQASRGFAINDIVKLLKILDCQTHLYLTGGEPLLHKKLLSVIKDLKNINKYTDIGLFTCGISNIFDLASSKNALELKRAGLCDCYISVYYMNSEIHDYITNYKQSYDRAIKAITVLVNAGIEAKIHLVLNKFNINEIDDIINKLTYLGVSEIRILRLVCSGDAKRNWSNIGVSYIEQEHKINEIINKIDTYKTKVTVSGFPEKYPCRPFTKSIKCQGGINVMYITYEGYVYPCACTKNVDSYLIGHVTEIERIDKLVRHHSEAGYNEKCLNPMK